MPAKDPTTPLRVTSAPEPRTGRPTTNSTPRIFRTYSSNRQSELKTSLEPQIREELKGKIVEVRTDAFIRAFLYMSNARRMKKDEEHAATCLSTLQADKPGPPASLKEVHALAPKYNGERFRQLNNLTSESHGYKRYANLLNYAGAFYRDAIEGSDADWPPAQEPGRDHTTSTTDAKKEHLLRIFRDTHASARGFSREQDTRAPLKPDLCLLIESVKKGKATPHWKDVLVPIEVKTCQMDVDAVTQCARYARAVMQEQFDRKFAFSVVIAANECRIFYWNVVGAHVTQPIDIHEDARTFLQVMGRFATMTPAELGYDTHFSNAGRVLSFQKDFKTHLTVHPTTPRTWLTLPPPENPTPECPVTSAPSPMVLEIKSPIFEARALLFNRATRVWRGVAFNDNAGHWTKGKTYIIKQNWADDSRPNEGSFHKLSETIPAVPRLVCLEECDTTYSFHAQIKKDEVVDVLPAVRSEHSSKVPIGTYSAGEFDNRSMNVDDEDSSGEGSQLAAVSSDDATGNGTDSDEGDNEWDENDEDSSIEDENEENPSIDDENDEAAIIEDENNNDDHDEGNYLERILLRFVFDHEGRSLDCAEDAPELLEATIQWIDGLRELHAAGIIHRDISYGNLMLPSPNMQHKQASIIDFGLAHWKDKTREGQGETIEGQTETREGQQDDMLSGEQNNSPNDSKRGPRWSSQPHCHVTGTLPFVAYELLKHSSYAEEHQHALHHDVESVFWVLLFIYLKRADYVPKHLLGQLARLNSREIGIVANAKLALLLEDYSLLLKGVGDFGGLKYFLHEFARHYQTCRVAEKSIDVPEVLDMAKRGLKEAREKAAELKQEAAKLKAAEAELKKAEAELKKAAAELKKAAQLKKATQPMLKKLVPEAKKVAKLKKAKAPSISLDPSTSQKPGSSNPPRINQQQTSDRSKATREATQPKRKNANFQLPTIDEDQQAPERKRARTQNHSTAALAPPKKN